MPKKKKYGDRTITATSKYTRRKGAMIVDLYSEGCTYDDIVDEVNDADMSLFRCDISYWRDEGCYKIGRGKHSRSFSAAMDGARGFVVNGILKQVQDCAKEISDANYKYKEAEARILCMVLDRTQPKDRGRPTHGKGKAGPTHVAYTYSVPGNPLVDGEEEG